MARDAKFRSLDWNIVGIELNTEDLAADGESSVSEVAHDMGEFIATRSRSHL